MRRQIALFDWDNTLSRGFTLLRWIDFLEERKYEIDKSQAAQIRLQYRSYQGGDIAYEDFAQTVVEAYVLAMTGCDAHALDTLGREFAEGDRGAIKPFARPLIDVLTARGVEIFVVSGAPSEPLRAHARWLGITHVRGLELARLNGRLIGHLLGGNTALATTKEAIAKALVAEGAEVLFAMGDSEADLPLYAHANLAVQVRGSELLPVGEIARSAYGFIGVALGWADEVDRGE